VGRDEQLPGRRAAYEESVKKGRLSLMMKAMEAVGLEDTGKAEMGKLTRPERRALHEEKLVNDRKRRFARLGEEGEAKRSAKIAAKKAQRKEVKENEWKAQRMTNTQIEGKRRV
jgi:hypothetical protein